MTTRTKTRTAGSAAGPGPPATPAPAASLRVRERAAWARAGPCCLPLAHSLLPPGPSWTAAFDPVPMDGPDGPQDCRDREPRGEHPDLPAPCPAGPATPSTLQLR